MADVSTAPTGRSRAVRALGATLVAATAAAGLTAAPAEARKRAVTCEAGYQNYRESGRFLRTTWSDTVRNLSPDRAITPTLTVDRAGTVSANLPASVAAAAGGGFAAFEASVQAQFGRDVSEAATAVRGSQIKVTVPARRQVRVRHGLWTRVYRGVVLAPPVQGPGAAQPASPVPLPAGCALSVVRTYAVTAPVGMVATSISKPRKLG